MTTEFAAMDRFVILADESAGWKIAGLYQLDRLVLALNEFAGSLGDASTLHVVIFWRSDIPPGSRWLPNDPRTKRLRMTEALSSLEPRAHILSTRLFVDRSSLAQFLEATPTVKSEEQMSDPGDAWQRLHKKFETFCLSALRADADKGPKYLNDLSDGPACERRILRQAGKSQDGLVSRFINRPISRAITGLLLRHSIDPTAWTISIFILPITALFFLLRGDYAGFVGGAVIFQIYSILDGCDGEIARAKYLESERGGRIDDFFDMLGSIIFVVGLGVGLFRAQSAGIYALEGILCAVVILSNEILLRLSKTQAASESSAVGQILYPRHRGMIQHSGLLSLGEKPAWWVIQFSKRDVAVFIFLLLAIAALPQWILHLWITVSGVTLFLTGRAQLSARARHGVAARDSQS